MSAAHCFQDSSSFCARCIDWHGGHRAWTSRRLTAYRQPASSVYAGLCPDETLDSEDFSDSFDADAGDGPGKKRSLHAAGRDSMDKTTKNVEDAVTIIDLLRST